MIQINLGSYAEDDILHNIFTDHQVTSEIRKHCVYPSVTYS